MQTQQDCSVLLQGSYMLDYFKYLYKYFEVGVPVYFVTKRGFDFTKVEGMNAVCSSVGCDQFSMTQKIRYATDYPDRWESIYFIIFLNLFKLLHLKNRSHFCVYPFPFLFVSFSLLSFLPTHSVDRVVVSADIQAD